MLDPYASITEPQEQEQVSDRGPPAEVEERNAPEEANVHATRRFSGESLTGGAKSSFDSASAKASLDSKRSSIEDPQLSPKLVDRSGMLRALKIVIQANTNISPQRLPRSNHAKEHHAMPTASSKMKASKHERYLLHLVFYVTTHSLRPAQQKAHATTALRVLSRHLLHKKRGLRETAKKRRKTRKATRSKACFLAFSRAKRRTRRAPTRAGMRANSATWRRCLLK